MVIAMTITIHTIIMTRTTTVMTATVILRQCHVQSTLCLPVLALAIATPLRRTTHLGVHIHTHPTATSTSTQPLVLLGTVAMLMAGVALLPKEGTQQLKAAMVDTHQAMAMQ